MNKKVSAKQSQTKRPLLPMILGVVVVILLAVIVFILSNKTDDTADLPNYTDVKEALLLMG